MTPLTDRHQQALPVESDRPREHTSSRFGWALYFGLLATFFTAVALWLLSRNYLNDSALWSWATVVGSLDAPQGGFNRFVLLYPQLQYYFLTVLSMVPGLKSPQLPYLMSAVAAAALMTHFTLRLRRIGVPLRLLVLIVPVIALNPIFLWSATNGGGEMFAILLYYILGLSMIVLRYSHSLHAHMMLGLVLVLFFITDARSVYLAITLVPLLPLVVQKHILRINPVAPILVLYCPLLFMIGIWLALNWVYTGDALAFLKDPASPFLGARASAEHLPWRSGYGTEFWAATGMSAGLMLLCYPVLALVQLPPTRRSRIYAAGLALGGMPIFASGLATWAEFTQSPADILVFAIGGVMALLTTGMMLRERPALVIGLLAFGMAGSVALFQRYPAVGMDGWFAAVGGRVAQVPKRGDQILGLWARGREEMMLDENTGYAVIGARGDALGLYLTFSDRFKEAVNSRRPTAAWIAVPSRLRDPRDIDQIGHNFPKLYDHGLPGYALVYDRPDWRVYASEEQLRRLRERRPEPPRETADVD